MKYSVPHAFSDITYYTCDLLSSLYCISYSQVVTLVGMWFIPLYFNVKLGFWRMLAAWTLFSLVTGFIVFKATRNPLAPTTPRYLPLFTRSD